MNTVTKIEELVTDQVTSFMMKLWASKIDKSQWAHCVKVEFPGLSQTQIKRIIKWFEENCDEC